MEPANGEADATTQPVNLETPPRGARPARLLPLMYFGAAHVSLLAACAASMTWAQATAGFFYHSWMIALVHLLTLGWITSSILGVLCIVTPAHLQAPWTIRTVDYFACGFVLVGIVGLVSHFWIEEFGGMAWSAATVAIGLVCVMVRVSLSIRQQPQVLGTIRLQIGFATFNLAAAASLGTLLGFDKVYHFLPGYVLTNVFAHAHLAALGWAAPMLAVLVPLLFPRMKPVDRSSKKSRLHLRAWILEIGTIGLVVSLLLGSRWEWLFGVVTGASLLDLSIDLARAADQAQQRDNSAKFNFAAWHVRSAAVFLALAVLLGLLLLVAQGSVWWPRMAGAYGVLGLLGFLAQLAVVVEPRAVGTLVSLWNQQAEEKRQPAATSETSDDARGSEAVVACSWIAGVPLVATGLSLGSAAALRAGATLLFGATLITAAKTGAAVLRLRPGTGRTNSQ